MHESFLSRSNGLPPFTFRLQTAWLPWRHWRYALRFRGFFESGEIGDWTVTITFFDNCLCQKQIVRIVLVSLDWVELFWPLPNLSHFSTLSRNFARNVLWRSAFRVPPGTLLRSACEVKHPDPAVSAWGWLARRLSVRVDFECLRQNCRVALK